MKNLILFIAFALTSVMVQAQTDQSNQKEEPLLMKAKSVSNKGEKAEQEQPENKRSEAIKPEKKKDSSKIVTPKIEEKLAAPIKSADETSGN